MYDTYTHTYNIHTHIHTYYIYTTTSTMRKRQPSKSRNQELVSKSGRDSSPYLPPYSMRLLIRSKVKKKTVCVERS